MSSSLLAVNLLANASASSQTKLICGLIKIDMTKQAELILNADMETMQISGQMLAYQQQQHWTLALTVLWRKTEKESFYPNCEKGLAH